MLDLARRGALRLIAEPVAGAAAGGASPEASYELFIERAPERSGNLTALERYLIDEVLFCQWPNASRVSLRDVMIEGARQHSDVCVRVETWFRRAREDPMPFPFEDPASQRASRVGMALGVLMFGVAYAVARYFESPLALLAIVLGGAMIAGSKVIQRRSPEAAEALARWQAFRSHVSASAQRADQSLVPVDTRWRFLIHAVTLGVANRLIDRFRLLYPSRQDIADSAHVYPTVFSPASDHWSRTLVDLAGTSRSGDGAEPR
jgi:hypothetical protein